jgi:hypothetical protein
MKTRNPHLPYCIRITKLCTSCVPQHFVRVCARYITFILTRAWQNASAKRPGLRDRLLYLLESLGRAFLLLQQWNCLAEPNYYDGPSSSSLNSNHPSSRLLAWVLSNALEGSSPLLTACDTL